MSAEPYIWAHPGRMGGAPCIGGTRLTTETIAGRVWAGDSVDEVAREYEVGRGEVLLACWYEQAHTRNGGARRVPWARWLGGNHEHLAAHRWDEVPDPPSRGAR